MRILFVMRHGGYVRNFEWVLRAFAERGHQVQLGFERGRAKGMEERIERGRGGFDLPDKLREETGSAVDHDLVPTREDRVAALGAHTFDHWFEWQPSTGREDFLRLVGLSHGPFLLYVCSSGFIAADERPIVASWVEALRVDPELAGVGVLVRPHPTNGAIWAEHSLGAFPNVAVWPRVGEDPTDGARRAGFYDSIHHSAAVVGANTTALIDAAIVGRRTYSILLPELMGVQEQTLHFHYLLPENGGALIVARSLEEHLGQLRGLLAGESAGEGWREEFLHGFVRPHGLDRPVAPMLVEDLERFVGVAREPVPA